MADNRDVFDGRLQRIGRKHSQLAHGYELHMQDDGLIVARPKRPRSYVPPRSLALFFIGFLAFKGVLIASLGPIAYDEKLDALHQGTVIEQAGAWVMMPDPVSREVGARLAPVLR